MALTAKGLTVGGIIGLAIAITVFANVIPSTITSLFAVDTVSWDASTAALFALIPLVIIAAFVLVFAPKSGKGA